MISDKNKNDVKVDYFVYILSLDIKYINTTKTTWMRINDKTRNKSRKGIQKEAECNIVFNNVRGSRSRQLQFAVGY